MQRQRGELVPIGEAFGGLGGPVQAIRDDSPQARHCFTQADQVNLLVSAREADPELGFMGRTMALCSLPRSNPGNRKEYKRVNGPYTLYMNAVGGCKLPFGNIPRLLMAWLSTEAVRTQSRELVLGKSLSEFMRSLGIYTSDGKTYTRLRNQKRAVTSDLGNVRFIGVPPGRVIVRVKTPTRNNGGFFRKTTTTGLALLLFLSILPGCAARHMPDWSRVQAVPPKTKTEAQLYKDKASKGSRKVKGRFDSATTDSLTLSAQRRPNAHLGEVSRAQGAHTIARSRNDGRDGLPWGWASQQVRCGDR